MEQTEELNGRHCERLPEDGASSWKHHLANSQFQNKVFFFLSEIGYTVLNPDVKKIKPGRGTACTGVGVRLAHLLATGPPGVATPQSSLVIPFRAGGLSSSTP